MAAVLVSGGNRGIGLSICKGLAQKGCRVFMGSRDLAKGEEAKESLGSELAALITVVALDVTSDESIAAAVAAVSVALGSGTSLAGLINNAGGTFGGGLGFSSADNWEATMNLNYLGGCVKMTEAFVPLLDKATGRLVNVSSGAAPTFVSKCSPEYIAKFCDWDTTSPESLMSIYEDAQKIAKEGGGDVDAVTAAFGAGGLGDARVAARIEEGAHRRAVGRPRPRGAEQALHRDDRPLPLARVEVEVRRRLLVRRLRDRARGDGDRKLPEAHAAVGVGDGDVLAHRVVVLTGGV